MTCFEIAASENSFKVQAVQFWLFPLKFLIPDGTVEIMSTILNHLDTSIVQKKVGHFRQ